LTLVLLFISILLFLLLLLLYDFIRSEKRRRFVLSFLHSSPFLSTDYGYELDDDDGFWIQGWEHQWRGHTKI